MRGEGEGNIGTRGKWWARKSCWGQAGGEEGRALYVILQGGGHLSLQVFLFSIVSLLIALLFVCVRTFIIEYYVASRGCFEALSRYKW